MAPEPPIPKKQGDQVPPLVQTALREVFQRFQYLIAYLEQRVRELGERPGRNSANASRPPSPDAPAAQRAPPRRVAAPRRGALSRKEPTHADLVAPHRLPPRSRGRR